MKWTSVEDRLPTEEDCLQSGTNVFLCTVLHRYDAEDRWRYRVVEPKLLHTDYKTWEVNTSKEKVIAWMPMPKAYQGNIQQNEA